ncbi:MAG: 50S ribosomal protein L1 [Phycisphaerales bacterium JB063]
MSRKKGKRYTADAAKRTDQALTLEEAVEKVKSFSPGKFDQTIELTMHLGIDPKQADQALRGSISLPHGVGGAAKRVIAFVSDDKVAAAKEAGAIEAGADELVAKIEKGWLDFDVAIAEPAMMRVVAKLGRQLGPKGLMPSPKAGTVDPNVPQAVAAFAAGKVEYRNDSGGNIHTPVGKQSFDAQKLVDNAQAMINHIIKLKPAAAKGQYVKRVSLSATMSPSVHVTI